jgi:sulfite exporter TauE/SafE
MDALLQLSLAAAFLAGLAGGVHCAAMCGPLIGIACGSRAAGRGAAWLRHALAYNAGRIATYMIAGAMTGAVGAAGLALRGTPLAQQTLLAVMSGSLVLLALYVAGFAPLVHGVERAGSALWRRVAPGAGRFLPADRPGRAFGLGLVFGWLPCGMVYGVLIVALATASPLHGALVMGAFGLGTLPNVLAISAWFRYFATVAKGRLARALIASVIAAAGVFGLVKATHPSAAGFLGQCLDVPGIGALFGAH